MKVRVLLIPVNISGVCTRLGNFIIEAYGSDKQMVCASSGARVARNISAKTVNKKGRFIIRRTNLFL